MSDQPQNLNERCTYCAQMPRQGHQESCPHHPHNQQAKNYEEHLQKHYGAIPKTVSISKDVMEQLPPTSLLSEQKAPLQIPKEKNSSLDEHYIELDVERQKICAKIAKWQLKLQELEVKEAKHRLLDFSIRGAKK